MTGDPVRRPVGRGQTRRARGDVPGIDSAYTLAQTGVVVGTAGLVGVDLAMGTYHFREHRVSLRDGTGGGGVVLGTLGAGWASCSSAVLAGLLPVFGATGMLAVLPLDGLEFALLAIGALVMSIVWLADGMAGGEVAGGPWFSRTHEILAGDCDRHSEGLPAVRRGRSRGFPPGVSQPRRHDIAGSTRRPHLGRDNPNSRTRRSRHSGGETSRSVRSWFLT